METKQKKHYITPQAEETLLDAMELIATSNASMSVFTDEEQNASGALANPFRGFGF